MFDRLEPIGFKGDDLQHGYTRRILIDVMGGQPKDKSKRFSTNDLTLSQAIQEGINEFRARYRKGKQVEQPRQTVDQMKEALKGLATCFKKKDK